MSESSPMPGRLRRALPRLILIVAAMAIAIANGSRFSLLAMAVVVVAVAIDGRQWWHYVVTGDRAVGKVAQAYAEPGQFTVELVDAGDRQIEVIKAVREVTGVGLAEARAHVMGAPSMLPVHLSEESARRVVERLGRAGATAAVVGRR